MQTEDNTLPASEVQKDENSVPPVTSQAETQTSTDSPPAGENSASGKDERESHVPYPRFREVNSRMRAAEEELVKLRAQLAPKTQKPSVEEREELDMGKYSRRLAEKGLDPRAAEALTEVMRDLAKEEAKERLGKYEAKQEERRANLEKSQREIAEWQENFRKTHADYAEYEAAMQKEWEGLDEGAKLAIVSSPKSYEMLYKAAKAATLEQVKAKGVDEGRKEAYSGKALKTAVSSTPGAVANPNKPFTPEDVGKMSTAEYKANKDKILKDLGIK